MDSEEVSPGNAVELVVDKEGFPLTDEQFSTLMDSKSTQILEQLGGIDMIAIALKTDLKTGLSEEEEKTDFATRRAVYSILLQFLEGLDFYAFKSFLFAPSILLV
jgi:hypothetical protein